MEEMCKFNIRTGLLPFINDFIDDCDVCREMYCMPSDYCCLQECGERAFCKGCVHGIYHTASIRKI